MCFPRLLVGLWLLIVTFAAQGIDADETDASDADLKPLDTETPELLDTGVGLKAPAGFSVELFADDNLAHDIFSMTIDARGRVVVAGKGYVKILHDDDGDGKADRASLFSRAEERRARALFRRRRSDLHRRQFRDAAARRQWRRRGRRSAQSVDAAKTFGTRRERGWAW